MVYPPILVGYAAGLPMTKPLARGRCLLALPQLSQAPFPGCSARSIPGEAAFYRQHVAPAHVRSIPRCQRAQPMRCCQQALSCWLVV